MSKDKNINFRAELEYDYNKYNLHYNNPINSFFEKWKEEGIFHRRLIFENDEGERINFYVTTAKVDIDYSFDNDYIIPNYDIGIWDNKNKRRVQELMKMTLGDESPKYGELIFYGNYKPDSDDLTKIRYRSVLGKEEFKSAKNVLFHIEENSERLINVDNFFRLKFELSDIGEQSKALYDMNSSIIDGSAGTGKSTIALQKLKYLSVNQNISQKEFLIIVKHSQLKQDFKSLLNDKNLNLNDIQIKTVNEFNANIQKIDLNFLEKNRKYSNKVKKIFEKFISNRDAVSIYNHYESLKRFLIEKSLFDEKEKYSLEDIEEGKDKNSNTEYKKYFLAFEYLHRYKNYYDDVFRLRTKKNTTKNKIKKIEDKLSDRDLTDKEFIIYEKLEFELSELEKKKVDKYHFTREKSLILKNILKKLYLNKNYMEYYLGFMPNDEKDLVIRYFDFGEYEYDTILIDEAQDYTLVELEVLRLSAKRVILTGDILQNFKNNKVKKWKDIILNIMDIYGIEDKNGKKKLNIFTLKHNFRQTYQLANASYNFRQLLLDIKLEDIEREYYPSEKKFNGKPYSLPKIIFHQDIKAYISQKIKHIKDTFTSQIPIVLICKTDKKKEEYKKQLNSFNLSFNTEQIKNIDVILLDILEAKGKQFPVVISSLDDLTDREIYLIMTRGQFEVEFLTKKDILVDKKLKILFNYKWMALQNIEIREQCIACGLITPNLNFHRPYCMGSFRKNIQKDKKEIVSNTYNQEKLTKVIRNLDMEKNRENQKAKEKIAKLNTNQDTSSNDKREEKKSKSKNQKHNDNNKSSIELIQNDLLEAKAKHQGEVEEIEKLLEPSVVSDINAYIKKVQEEYEYNIKNAPTTVTTHIVNRKVKIGRKETKWFLEQQYKGYCQICGFTFTKRGKNGGKYFELFDWFSQKITGQKVNIVQSGSSL